MLPVSDAVNDVTLPVFPGGRQSCNPILQMMRQAEVWWASQRSPLVQCRPPLRCWTVPGASWPDVNRRGLTAVSPRDRVGAPRPPVLGQRSWSQVQPAILPAMRKTFRGRVSLEDKGLVWKETRSVRNSMTASRDTPALTMIFKIRVCL